MFTDSNFPLEGDVSAVGRSIVILSPNKDGARYACANIEPDYDIIKYINIEKPPRFVLYDRFYQQFLKFFFNIVCCILGHNLLKTYAKLWVYLNGF